jgi:UDPglucose 6-dehydrogenase
MYKIGIIGIGVLGNAIKETFENFKKDDIEKGVGVKLGLGLDIKCYDRYKNIGSGIYELLDTDMVFLCLPTLFNSQIGEYDKQEIYNVCSELEHLKYSGIVILKSTVEPQTTKELSRKYKSLKLVHNPEFLTARTATADFINQKHIILGFLDEYHECNGINIIQYLEVFFKKYFPLAKISICSTDESECVKIFCNSFYATKIQFFTEIKLLCDRMGVEYNSIRDLMLLNDWINPMHTVVPGSDGQISFGGMCFPKDIKALNEVMKKNNVSNGVLEAVIKEREIMRKD